MSAIQKLINTAERNK